MRSAHVWPDWELDNLEAAQSVPRRMDMESIAYRELMSSAPWEDEGDCFEKALDKILERMI